MVKNQETYSNTKIVKKYAKVSDLQLPELTILESLKSKLQNMKMLDIGVGTGRTAYHFANLTKEYIGIDYSEPMIQHCKKEFANSPNNITFQYGDVVNLKEFNDNYFDFILFSFNGLDYISHESRQIALKEIHRIGKQNGYFCLSTHNILSTDTLFDFKNQFSLNPLSLINNIKRWIKLKSMYPKPNLLFNNKNYIVFNDGSLNFNLETYYVNPAYQKKQLENNFSNVDVYSLDGEQIGGTDNLLNSKDPWLYYLCNFKKI